MPKGRKLHKNIVVAFARLVESGGLLCRQYSNSEVAKSRGGDYLYFTVKNNEEFPTGSGLFLIDNGLVSSCKDGLLDETPQTFEAVSFEEFYKFKEDYERAQESA